MIRKCIAAVCGVLLSNSTFAQLDAALDEDEGIAKPLWEAGAFAAGFVTPEYPAAQSDQTNFIAAPYFVYRGDVFRIGDGSAARAVALEKDWIEIDVSLDGAFNADSDEDSARDGMPDLDYIFEFGPQVKLRLAQYELAGGPKAKLTFKIQTRAVFSTDFSSIDHRGYVFHPELTYQQTRILQEEDRLTLNLSPVWATEKLHDYFYQVDPVFQTEDRPAYQANAGYLGTELSAGYLFDATKDIRIFVGASAYFHDGAANKDSPLFFKKDTYSFGLGMIWRLFQSEEKAR